MRTHLLHRENKMTTEDDADARDNVVDQPPKISRTSYLSYAKHKTRLSTDFVSWAFAALVIVLLVFVLALVIHEIRF
jgi:hypothetical protein